MTKLIPKNEIEVPLADLKTRKFAVPIVGLSPLIVHAWSEKAKRQMLDKQMKRAKAAKEAKDPKADFENAKYKVNGKDCFPISGFKKALVQSARFVDSLKMTFLRGAFFIEGEYAVIDYQECVMREDMVRLQSGVADIRYRPEYRDWSTTLTFEINENAISIEQVVALVRVGGFSVGIGEWRPERDGQYGRFAPRL